MDAKERPQDLLERINKGKGEEGNKTEKAKELWSNKRKLRENVKNKEKDEWEGLRVWNKHVLFFSEIKAGLRMNDGK